MGPTLLYAAACALMEMFNTIDAGDLPGPLQSAGCLRCHVALPSHYVCSAACHCFSATLALVTNTLLKFTCMNKKLETEIPCEDSSKQSQVLAGAGMHPA